jgi:hypothetical protein
MLRALLVSAMICVGLVLSPATMSAQSLQDLMSQTFVQQVVLARTPGGVGVVAHEPIFATDPTVTDVTTLIQQISQQIGAQLSTFPVGSSSGGFTYKYDPTLGTFTRSTQTFGPAFAERASTVGKQKFNLGMNLQHSNYTTLDGRDLANGDIKFFLLHQQLSPRSFVEGDVIEADLRMKLTSDTAVFYGNYGVTDALDIGVAVPVVQVKMDLTYNATILDFATRVVDPTRHLFGNGKKTQDFTSSGSANGVGDIVVRAKYAFMKREARGLAAGLDLRLPTGAEENMLGSGATQAGVFLIASSTSGRVSPHVNVGYTGVWGGTGVSDQLNYVGGVEFAVTPKLTVVADGLGRTLRNPLRLQDISEPHGFQQGTGAAFETVNLQEVTTESRSLSSILGTVGVKFNPWQNLLLSAHVVVPLNDAGLRSRVTPVVGFDYSF